VHGQKVRNEPRELLAVVPGLNLVPLRESDICCGAAGTYNLTQPEMSLQLSARKAGNIKDSGAKAVVVGNMSCAMQIGSAIRNAGSAVDVIHPMDLLARAYGIE
jgi:glycolate oxidase iron-sulfur subunit